MELPETVSLLYVAKDSEEAARLEKAINAIPLKLELSDIKYLGSGPKILVTPPIAKSELKSAVLRPHNCRISGIVWLGMDKLTVTYFREREKTLEYKGYKYYIVNERTFY